MDLNNPFFKNKYTRLWRPRRPLAYIASAYISGIAFCYFFAPSRLPLAVCLVVCATTAVCLLSVHIAPVWAPFILFIAAVFLAGGLYAHFAFSRSDPLEREMTDGAGYAEEVVGHVLFSEQRAPDYRLLTVWADGRKLLVRVYGEKGQAMTPAPEKMIGTRVSLKGALSYPDTARNPRCFDYRLYLMTIDIRLIMTCENEEDVLILERNPMDVHWSALALFASAKAAFSERVRAVLSPGDSALFAGMLFGDTREMDEETYDLFKRNGIAHILSVSGLHVGMVYAFVSMALGRRKTKTFYIAVLILLLCYAILSNFSPPVMRAFSMIAVHIGARLLNQRYDMLTGVLLSALIMLLFNPLALFGIGFLLSYTAVCSLSFALPLVSRYTGFRNKLTGRNVKAGELSLLYGATLPVLFGGRALKLLIPAGLIQLFVLPLTVNYFNCLPLLATFVNIPVIALSSLIIPFGLIVLLLSAAGAALPGLAFVLEPAAEIGASSSGVLLDLMVFLTRAADQVPGSSPTVPSPPIAAIVLFYCGAFFLMSDTFAMSFTGFRYTLNGLALPAVIGLSCLFLAAIPFAKQNDAAYTFVDVGQGDCLHIRTTDGRNYLMDGGGKYDYNVGKNILAPYLLKNGVGKLDGVFVSHLHMDHFKGLTELAAHMDIGPVCVYDGYRVREAAVTCASWDGAEGFGDSLPTSAGSVFHSDNILYLAAGDAVQLGNNTRAETLFPPRLSESEYVSTMAGDTDENLASLIMRFETGGVSVLMTGDIAQEGELSALDISDLRCDILKISHHGSKTSTSDALLACSNPAAVVIQVGKNNYGHPTPEILEKLAAADLPVYRNDKSGAIFIRPRPGGFTVQTVKRDFVSPMLLKPYEK